MTPDWNKNPDFHILFLPRSGSHMLVSALNSHPDIDCTHSDQGHHGRGFIKGHAHTVPEHASGKVIVLVRNSVDRMKSFYTTMPDQIKDNHTYEPLTVQRKDIHKIDRQIEKAIAKTDKWLERCKELHDVLYVSYEDLTGGKDVRVIEQKWTNLICDHIGVLRLPLTTKLHKPTVDER